MNPPRLERGVVRGLFVCLLACPVARVTAQCVDGWTAAGLNATQISGLAVFDDGSGSKLFVSGSQVKLAGNSGPSLGSCAAWDGTQWKAAGPMPATQIRLHTLAMNGTTGLYATMSSTVGGVAQWKGSAWVSMNCANAMHALTVFDDGGGEALYASGFDSVRKYDGLSWPIIGNAHAVYGPSALAVYNDGGVEALYLGGFFDDVSGVRANGFAKWDGVAWSEVGGGVSGQVAPPFPPGVTSLTVFQGRL